MNTAIGTLGSQDWDEARALLSTGPPPYSFYRRVIRSGELEKLQAGRRRSLLESPHSRVTAARNGNGPYAAVCRTMLPWDSEQFGFPAARLDFLLAEGEYHCQRQAKAQLLEEMLQDCRRHGIHHLTARIDTGDFSSLHALESAGFELIDGIQTFSMEIATAPAGHRSPDFETRLFRPADLEQVLEIARSSYIYDRFHADAALRPGTADALHECWLRNSCAGTAADAVVIAARGAEVLGYVTCKLDPDSAALGFPIGTIVLVATGRNARGCGVGRSATLAAMEWFRGQGVTAVEVGTQLRNVPASRLYENCGFRLAGVSLTLRRIV